MLLFALILPFRHKYKQQGDSKATGQRVYSQGQLVENLKTQHFGLCMSHVQVVPFCFGHITMSSTM